MVKLFKKAKEKVIEVIDKPYKYIVYAESLVDSAFQSQLGFKLFKEEKEAMQYAQDGAKYFEYIVCEIKPLYKYKNQPVVEIL
jgi:hypothetical protein